MSIRKSKFGRIFSVVAIVLSIVMAMQVTAFAAGPAVGTDEGKRVDTTLRVSAADGYITSNNVNLRENHGTSYGSAP